MASIEKRFRTWLVDAAKRTALLLFVTLACLLVAGCLVVTGAHLPPNPLEPRAWRALEQKDIQATEALALSSLVSAAGLVATLFQIFLSKAGRESTSKLLSGIKAAGERITREVKAEGEATRSEIAELKAMIAALQASRGDISPPDTPEAEAEAQAGSLKVLREDKVAADLIATGRVQEGFDRVRRRAAEAEGREAEARREAAAWWRALGGMAYAVNVSEALTAFERAAELEPADFWCQVFLARLCGAAGRSSRRATAARAALAVARDDRERSTALVELGDVLSTQSDLTGALTAYQEGLGLRRKLAADEPSNAERQRDVSVSLERVGDVLSTQSDLTGALTAYQEGLAIRRKLAADDPSNAERQRDVSVSLDRVGDVLRTQSDLTGALTAYQEGLGLRRKLAADDSSNAERQIDLGVSLAKLGQTAEASGHLGEACGYFTQARVQFQRLADRAPDHHRLNQMAKWAATDAARVCGDAR